MSPCPGSPRQETDKSLYVSKACQSQQGRLKTRLLNQGTQQRGKNMKKLMILLVILLVSLTMSGCGDRSPVTTKVTRELVAINSGTESSGSISGSMFLMAGWIQGSAHTDIVYRGYYKNADGSISPVHVSEGEYASLHFRSCTIKIFEDANLVNTGSWTTITIQDHDHCLNCQTDVVVEFHVPAGSVKKEISIDK